MAQNLPKTKQSVKESFEEIASDWDRLRGNPWPVLLEFLENSDVKESFSSDYLLDLGCGNGRHMLFFADKSKRAIGVDFVTGLLEIARKKSISQGIDNVSYIMADITALPFRKGVFSNILFLATLHHIPMQENRLVALTEVKHILKNGGLCLISVWRKWQKRFFWHFFKQSFVHVFTFKSFKEFGDIFIPWKKQDDVIVQRFYHLFSRREMKKLLKKTELDIASMENFGGPTQRDNLFCIIKNEG